MELDDDIENFIRSIVKVNTKLLANAIDEAIVFGESKINTEDLFMPFKSKAQEREMFANQPKIAKRWAKETPDIKSLPEHVKKKKKGKKK